MGQQPIQLWAQVYSTAIKKNPNYDNYGNKAKLFSKE